MSQAVLRVAVICTGNICRSPMAEVIIRHRVNSDPLLRGRVLVTSAGIEDWHVGSPMDERARAALDRAGFRGAGTAASFADRQYLDEQDVVIVMTREQLHEVRGRRTGPSDDVYLLRSFEDPDRTLDVTDPYYGTVADFDECCFVISRTVPRLTSEFRRRFGADSYEA